MIIDNGRSRYHIGYSSLRWQETEDQRIRVLQMPIPGKGHEDIEMVSKRIVSMGCPCKAHAAPAAS